MLIYKNQLVSMQLCRRKVILKEIYNLLMEVINKWHAYESKQKTSDRCSSETIHCIHLNPEKLGDANLVGGINCLPETAYEMM